MRVFGFLSICIGLYIFSASSGSQHVWMAWSLMGCGFVLYRMGVSRAKKKKEAEQKLNNKESVKQVVTELAEMKKENQIQREQLKAQIEQEKEKAKPKPPPNPYENLI